MKIRCLHSLEQIAPLRPAIDALNLDSQKPDPFSTFEFYETLLLHLPSDDAQRGVWFLVALDDSNGDDLNSDGLLGYLALVQTTRRVFGRKVVTLNFLVGYDTDRPHVVAAERDLGAVTKGFYSYLNERRDWDLLEFEQQDAASTLYPPPAQIRMRGCSIKQWPNMDNFTIPIRWPTTARYFQSLSKKFRSELRRGFRKLFAAGKVELLTSTDPHCTPWLFDLYTRIEAHSWKSQMNLSVGGEVTRLERLRGLLRPNQPMRIVIQILLLDGAPVAGLISGSFTAREKKGLYALQIVFDDRVSTLSPGSAVLLFGIRYAIESGHAFFNWLSGFGHYKTRWLAELTPTRCGQIYRIGRLPFWHRLAGDLRRVLRRDENRDALAGEPRELFNPLRRQAGGMLKAAEADSSPTLQSEMDQVAQIVARLRDSGCEFLDAATLAKAMPFAIESPGELPGQVSNAVAEQSRVRRQVASTTCA